MFDCTCNAQNSLLLNQHNGDDAPQDHSNTLSHISIEYTDVTWRSDVTNRKQRWANCNREQMGESEP
jgi:hypothetical protein